MSTGPTVGRAIRALTLAGLGLALASCGTGPAPAAAAGEPLEVPHFEGSDPRVGSAGFFGMTKRLDVEVDGVAFGLMLFSVDHIITLGATVRDAADRAPFVGSVHWSLDDAELELPFEVSGGEFEGRLTKPGAPARRVLGEAARVRTFRWITADYRSAGLRSVALEFRDADGAVVTTLGPYALRLVDPPSAE